MSEPLLVFDMDGVLVDVTESYRETIQRTVEHFTGHRISREEIQDWKNRGGWNDDWALSHRLISDAGARVDYQVVVDYFNSIFHGDGTSGLILRERWIARSLQKAFEESRRVALEDLRETVALKITLPWLTDHVEHTTKVFGTDDFWTYGVGPNRETLAAFLRYSCAHGLIPRVPEPDELFAPETVTTART